MNPWLSAARGAIWLMGGGAFLLWLGLLWLAPRKPHRLCGGHGCRMCGYTGKRYRSAVAGWLRRRKQ